MKIQSTVGRRLSPLLFVVLGLLAVVLLQVMAPPNASASVNDAAPQAVVQVVAPASDLKGGSIGDSYGALSSGQPLRFLGGCLQMVSAWPHVLHQQDVVDLGASLERYLNCPGADLEATIQQLKQLPDDLDVLMVVVGGNPYFGKILGACVPPTLNCGVDAGYVEFVKQTLRVEPVASRTRLMDAIDAKYGDDTLVIVVGYGNLTPLKASALSAHCPYLELEELTPIRQFENIINAGIESSARERGHVFVDPRGVLDPFHLCKPQSTPWGTPASAYNPATDQFAPFHYNAFGNERVATMVEHAVRTWATSNS